MSYSRITFQGLHRDPNNPGEYDRIVQELCDIVFNDGEITLAEEYFAGVSLNSLETKRGKEL